MRQPTCECGLAYVKGHPEDERVHRKRHNEFNHGPTVRELSKVPTLSSFGDFAIKRVDSNVPLPVRAAVARVAFVAQRETPEFKVGYDGTITDENPILYVAASSHRAVAMVLIATTSRSWHLRWIEQGRACLVTHICDPAVRPKVGRVWVAAKARRQGIARRLLAAVTVDVATPIDQLAWQLPFSEPGAKLVQSLAPSDWFGDGDMFDLEAVLSAAANCGN